MTVYHMYRLAGDTDVEHLMKTWEQLQNSGTLWSTSFTCVGTLSGTRHNTIDTFLIQIAFYVDYPKDLRTIEVGMF